MPALLSHRSRLAALTAVLLAACFAHDAMQRRWALPALPPAELVLCTTVLLAILAVAPWALISWLRHGDDERRHPWPLLASLFAMGALVGPVAGLVEGAVAWAVFDAARPSLASHVIFWYWAVAGSEELVKFAVVYAIAWRGGRIASAHDAVVYAGAAALGFAAAENLIYTFTAGDKAMAVAIGRSLIATPGHLAYGILIGAGMGHAWRRRRHPDGSQWMVVGLGGAVTLHGTYDFLLVALRSCAGLVLPVVALECAAAWWLARSALRRDAALGSSADEKRSMAVATVAKVGPG